MRPTRLRSLTVSRSARLSAALALAATAMVVLAACGSSAKTTSSSGSSRSAQVLYTVKSGNLVETASGRATLTSTKKSKVAATVQIMGAEAAQVAAGQSVTVTFVKLPAGFGSGANGRPSGAPSPGSGPSGTGSQANGGSQGFSGGSGGQTFSGPGGQGGFRGKTATATVTGVEAGSNGAVKATISIAKLPAGVTTKYTGIAQIEVKVLASNVLIVPRAAIKGSGSSATVQLLQNGKTATQSVTVGQQTQTEAEITSGLSAGQSIIYTRTFSGFPGGRNGNPGQGGGFPGGQGGAAPSGQPGQTTGGA